MAPMRKRLLLRLSWRLPRRRQVISGVLNFRMEKLMWLYSPRPGSLLLTVLVSLAPRLARAGRKAAAITFTLVAAAAALIPQRAGADIAYAWGHNQWGEVGDGTTNERSTPIAVSGLLSQVTAVAGGGQHSLGLQGGAVYAWGYNNAGQIGGSLLAQSNVPRGGCRPAGRRDRHCRRQWS